MRRKGQRTQRRKIKNNYNTKKESKRQNKKDIKNNEEKWEERILEKIKRRRRCSPRRPPVQGIAYGKVPTFPVCHRTASHPAR